MWPKRNDGALSPEWIHFSNATVTRGSGGSSVAGVPSGIGGYILHLDHPGLAGAVAMPDANAWHHDSSSGASRGLSCRNSAFTMTPSAMAGEPGRVCFHF